MKDVAYFLKQKMFEFHYSQIIEFRKFRDQIIKYFANKLDYICSLHGKYPKRSVSHNFVTKVFTKWWFFTYLVDNNSGFFPSTLDVQESDLEYYLKTFDITDIKVDYNINHIQSLLDKYIQDTYTYMSKYEGINISVDDTGDYINISIISGFIGRWIPEVLETLRISHKQWQSMKNRFKENPLYSFEEAVTIEALRLHSLGSISEHLSVPPILLDKLNIDTELFGTPINTTLDKFCSPFSDVESCFGSVGNHLDYELQSGKNYTFNPPYDLALMNIVIDRLIAIMRSVPDLQVLVVIPVWDPQTQKEIGFKYYDTEFKGFQQILDSGFVKERSIMHKDEYPYYDYFSDKPISSSTTHVIILSNRVNCDWTISNIKDIWKNSFKIE